MPQSKTKLADRSYRPYGPVRLRKHISSESSRTSDSSDAEAESVSSLLISQSKHPSQDIMSTPAPKVTIDLPDKVLKIIPHYDGTRDSAFRLPMLISTIQELNTAYCSPNNELANINSWTLVKSAISKISGPAELIIYNNNVETVEQLITVLQNNFGDTRTVHDLISEIPLMRAHPKEHPVSFLNRLIEKQAYIVTKYRTDEKYNNSIDVLVEQLDMLLVNTLIHGIPPKLGSHLQIMQPRSLDHAHRLLQNDCSILLNDLNFGPVNSQQELKRHQPSSPKPQRYNYYQRPNFNNFPNFSNQHQYRQNNYPNFNNQQNFNQHQYRQNNYPNSNNQQFRQNVPNVGSQNTVSMRTVTSQNKFNKHNRSPYEINHLEESNTQNEISQINKRLDKLTEALTKVTDHFLDQSSNPEESPPPNLN